MSVIFLDHNDNNHRERDGSSRGVVAWTWNRNSPGATRTTGWRSGSRHGTASTTVSARRALAVARRGRRNSHALCSSHWRPGYRTL
ncbi:hypothetical protein B566_EDAN007407, partial [Ephemera danica]